jgi:hypothetical protein
MPTVLHFMKIQTSEPRVSCRVVGKTCGLAIKVMEIMIVFSEHATKTGQAITGFRSHILPLSIELLD